MGLCRLNIHHLGKRPHARVIAEQRQVCRRSNSEGTAKGSFDTGTITGSMEYIIAYARKTWGCPVIFYTGTRYDSPEYEAMVRRLLELQQKWGIGVIDLWNDPQMNAVSPEDYALYMYDSIHPTRAGYRDWWTPKFAAALTELL